MKKQPQPKKKPNNRIVLQPIVEEMETSYLDYAMSVIVSRALPDVRDGLKPVHRRILYAMWELGLKPGARFRKSATVVGHVIGRYHPHGDTAVYDSMVRLAQDFSLRYPLVNGQGNFGCFTGDTKVKLTDGHSLSFLELIDEEKQGKKNYTYTFNDKTQEIEIRAIKKPRKTIHNAKLMKVSLDTGREIRCTLNHKFMLRDGTYREAQDLQAGDSLMPCYSRLSTKKDDPHAIGYTMILQPIKGSWTYAHRMADALNIKEEVYPREAGRVRHHKDFNKLNNDPDNILRMDWKEHWLLHATMASWRHKNDPEYVKKLALGRKKFFKENKERLSKRRAELNKELWKDEAFRAQHSKRIKEKWADPEYKAFMKDISSKNLKKLWQDPAFKQKISALKSKEMKKRWQDPEYRAYWEVKMRKLSKKWWSNPAHREHMSVVMKKIMRDPVRRAQQSEQSKALWKNAEYRSHYSEDHFSKMAQKLWQDPKTKRLHKLKAHKQWNDPNFRANILNAIKTSNHKRIVEDPTYMKRLADKAGASLKNKWQDPEYKRQVMRSKILGFVHGLLQDYNEITPELFNKARTNNGIPRLENALHYFNSFDEILEQAPLYNHTVLKTEILNECEDVYDLTIDGTHNFLLDAGIFVHNSVDGDSAAAMRYTEAKLQKITETLLQDIEKDTVNFRDNYDSSQKEPSVLPGKLPNLLLNGTLGIAVGMATNIPPHHLGEVCDATIHLIENPDATVEDLMKFIKGPDFPTGGIIFNESEIKRAYATGKGSIVMRAKANIIENKNGYKIQVDEIPYQVNKAQLIEKIADLVKEGKLTDIKGIRDESDRNGMRISIDLKKESYPKKVLNQLFQYTRLQDTFHVNMLALVDGIQPRVMPLKMILEEFIKHRHVVIRRRTEFDLKNAKDREHILKGLVIALENIDAIIETIKKSEDRDVAKVNLIKKFKLSEKQSEAILQMRLQSLSGLEQLKVEKELEEKRKLIKKLEALLKSNRKILGVISKELGEIKEQFNDERRTKVIKTAIGKFAQEDLIPKAASVIMITKDGYIKRLAPGTFKSQGRGGKGVIGLTPKEEDSVSHLISTDTHTDLLFFTNSGKVFQLKAYEVPEASRTAKGAAVVNFLELNQDEKVTAVLPLKNIEGAAFLVMATEGGVVKKIKLKDFANVRRSGLIAIKLKENDVLRWVKQISSDDDVLLTTARGLAIRFKDSDLRPMGRPTQGVIGIKLNKTDRVVGMDVIHTKEKDAFLLAISKNGYGKMTSVKEYRVQSRAGKGIKTMNVTARNGALTNARVIDPKNLPQDKKGDLILISDLGQVIRIKLSSVPKQGRATQGVRLMKLKSTRDTVSQVAVV